MTGHGSVAAIHLIALLREAALFAGSVGGAGHWAGVASLIETCQLNGGEPQAYPADVIARIIAGHLQIGLDDLLPWAYALQPPRPRRSDEARDSSVNDPLGSSAVRLARIRSGS